MKPFEYYSTTTTSYPNRKDYITVYIYDKGKLIWSGSSYEFLKLDKSSLPKNYVKQEILDEDKYKKDKIMYAEEEAKLKEQFKNDLFDEFAVSDNPKRDKLYDIAWERGHAYGHEEVYIVFDSLVDLIK